MALYQYNGPAGLGYPAYDLSNMQPGDIVDFGTSFAPNDGRWALYGGGSPANHLPDNLTVVYPPGSQGPTDGLVLVWSSAAGRYVPTDLSQSYAPVSAGVPSGGTSGTFLRGDGTWATPSGSVPLKTVAPVVTS